MNPELCNAGEASRRPQREWATWRFSVAATCLAATMGLSPTSIAEEGDQKAAQDDAWGGTRLFDARLAAENQTTYTQSDGRAYAKISLNIYTLEIEWQLEFDNLTSPPVGVHLHGPAQPGTNAVAIIDLGINGLESPVSGTMKIPDGYAQYMLLGWSYVLLKTENYPEGELRGKLDTVPPPGYLEKSAQWGRGEL